MSLDDFETTVRNQADSEEVSSSCHIRRKIEDYLERRRYRDEFGNPNESDDYAAA